MANAGSGLLGGLAGGGSLSQSAVNEGAGARSEVSPLVAAALIARHRAAADAAVQGPARGGAGGADHPRRLAPLEGRGVPPLLRRAAGPSSGSALATLVGVITLDVLPGLVIGVVVDAAARRLPREPARTWASSARVPGVPGAYGDVERHPDYEHVPGLLVLRLEAPLFYANAAPVRDRDQAARRRRASRSPRAVILDVGRERRPRHHQRRDPRSS